MANWSFKAALQPEITHNPQDAMKAVWDFTKDMRFGPREIAEIAHALLPEKVAARDRNGHIIVSTDNVVALGVVLYHLATPSRQDRQATFWGRSVSWVSQIFHATLDILYDTAMVVFRRWPETHLSRVEEYCNAMSRKSRTLLHAHALMDGSGLFVCRPSRENTQQHYYSGAEGGHVLRIVAVLSLSGMFVRIFGPYAGSASDACVTTMERLEEQLTEFHAAAARRHPAMTELPKVLGDAGFSWSENVTTPFSRDRQTRYAPENVFNMILSRCRVPVEWGFGRMLNLFRTLQLRDNLKVDWTAAKKQYIVAILLTNLSNCCSPAQVSQYYDCAPPTLTEYLSEVTGTTQRNMRIN